MAEQTKTLPCKFVISLLERHWDSCWRGSLASHKEWPNVHTAARNPDESHKACHQMSSWLVCSPFLVGKTLHMCSKVMLTICTSVGNPHPSFLTNYISYAWTISILYPNFQACDTYIYILAYADVMTWTCWNTHKCWHRCACVHEMCMYMCTCIWTNIALRYSHKSIWVNTCNVNAHIYIYIYTCT